MGLRNMASYLVEISQHLVEDTVFTTVTQVIPPGTNTATVASTDALYPGAQVVLQDSLTPANTEVITVSAVNLAASTITATFAHSHQANQLLYGGTFPTQQPTDPLFTQAEVLSYLARAQNEFLNRLPCIYAIAKQNLLLGQIYQATPPNSIEMERVAVENGARQASIYTVVRQGGVVTAQTTSPSGFAAGTTVTVAGVSNSTFNIAEVNLVTSLGTTLTWAQAGPDAVSIGGTVGYPLLTRLYETTQEQVSMRDPQWFYNARSPVPLAWFEDRTGLYGWGVAPPPQAGFPVEVLYSTRGPQTLGMLDTFLTPDMVGMYMKYWAMAQIYSKDGEQRSPQSADYCMQRFERGVAIVDRYLRNVQEVGG